MNVEVIARVRPAKRGENATLKVSGNRIQASNATECAFSSVYTASTPTSDLYKESFQPLIDPLLAGYNVCIIAFGETGSGKSYSLAGEKTAKAGLIPLLINSVFVKLREIQNEKMPTRMQANRIEDNVVSITIQMYEVYNETIKDLLLLPHQDRAVQVTEDGAKGVYIRGGTLQRVTDAADCTTAFRKGWNTRCQSQTDFGAAEAKSAIFFMLDISLTDFTHDRVQSQLLVVELPGAEKLADDPMQLRMREGPTINRSILTLGSLVTALTTSPQGATTFNYSDSVVTMLLREALGQNCTTKVLTTLHPSETVALPTVLKTAAQFTQIQNFPVVNGYILRMLISQYRTKILQLESQSKHLGSSLLPENSNSGFRAQELRVQMTQMTNENIKLQEQNEQLYARLEQMQGRYNDLMDSKTQISSKLIYSEEEKLQVSKTLVDLQLENNRILEEAEAAQFELTNKILALENRVLELENLLERGRRSENEAKEHLSQLQREIKELTDEYIVLKSNHLSLTQDYQQEVSKNEEMGLELLGLVNVKEKLIKDKEEDRIKHMQDYYGQLRHLASKFSRSSLREKNDLSKSLISLQSEKFELEKQLLQTGQTRDGRIEILNSQHQLQMKKLENRINKLQDDLKVSKSMYREGQRKIALQNAELITAKSEQSRVEKENDSLDIRFRELNQEYTNRLQQYVHDIALFFDQTKNERQQFTSENLEAHIDTTMRNIQESYERRAESSENRVRELKATLRDIITKHGKLLAAYRLVQYELKSSKGEKPFAVAVDEEFTVPTSKELDTAQALEIDRLTEALRESEKSEAILKTKLTQITEKFDHYKEGHQAARDNTEAVLGVESSWGNLRTQLREFTLNTQQELEQERASLLTRCVMAEELLLKLQDSTQTQIKRYQEEIVRLKKLLAEKSGQANRADALGSFGNVR